MTQENVPSEAKVRPQAIHSAIQTHLKVRGIDARWTASVPEINALTDVIPKFDQVFYDGPCVIEVLNWRSDPLEDPTFLDLAREFERSREFTKDDQLVDIIAINQSASTHDGYVMFTIIGGH